MAEESVEAGELKVRLVMDAAKANREAEEVKKKIGLLGRAQDAFKRKVDTSWQANANTIKTFGVAALGTVATAALAVTGSMIGLGVAASHAFSESEGQVRMLAGTFALLDENANDFSDIKEYAAAIKDEMEDLAIETGNSDDEMVNLFNNIIDRGGKSVDQAKQLTAQMALAGRAVPGGADEISNAFEQIQIGSIRSKNAIVGIIAATGTLKGNAKQVAAQMQKMSVDEQMKIAEQAIAKMADKMKAAPMSIGQLAASFKVMSENVLESIGEPINEQLGKILGKGRDFFMRHEEEIQQFADRVGDAFGRGLEVGGLFLDKVFEFAEDHAAEIGQVFEDFTDPFREAFEYVYENREAFASTFKDILSLLLKVMETGAKFFKAAVEGPLSLLKKGGKAGVFGSGVQEQIAVDDQKDVAKKFHEGVLAGKLDVNKDADNARKQYVEAAKGTKYEASAGAEFDKLRSNYGQEVKQANQAIVDAQKAAQEYNTQQFADSFRKAAQLHSEAAETNIVAMLKDADGMQAALLDTADLFGEGADEFIKTLKGAGMDDFAKKFMRARRPDLGISKPEVNFNFPGAQFNIKQDFRDQDPDRVLIVMRKDLQQNASSRIQSRLASPFGM